MLLRLLLWWGSPSLKTVALRNPEILDRIEGVCSHSCALQSSNVAAAVLVPVCASGRVFRLCCPQVMPFHSLPSSFLSFLAQGHPLRNCPSPLGALHPLCSLLSSGVAPALPARLIGFLEEEWASPGSLCSACSAWLAVGSSDG